MNPWGLGQSQPPDLVHQDTHIRTALANVARVGATPCAVYPQHSGHLGVCTAGGSMPLKTGSCFEENWLHFS